MLVIIVLEYPICTFSIPCGAQVRLGADIIVEWKADQTSSRAAHPLDWIGLFEVGDCLPEEDEQGRIRMNNYKPISNVANKCWKAWQRPRPSGSIQGVVRFTVDEYKYAGGQYEVPA